MLVFLRRSAKAAKRNRDNLIKFLEDTMKCPVNRKKTKIAKIGDISLLGVYARKGKWYIDREKLLQMRDGFRTWIEKHTRTLNEDYVEGSIRRIGGFLAHYQQIPGIARLPVEIRKAGGIL